eukprot:SAG11_NODE_2646_length_3132_cov_4.768216_2_plen_108_part_00
MASGTTVCDGGHHRSDGRAVRRTSSSPPVMNLASILLPARLMQSGKVKLGSDGLCRHNHNLTLLLRPVLAHATATTAAALSASTFPATSLSTALASPKSMVASMHLG